MHTKAFGRFYCWQIPPVPLPTVVHQCSRLLHRIVGSLAGQWVIYSGGTHRGRKVSSTRYCTVVPWYDLSIVESHTLFYLGCVLFEGSFKASRGHIDFWVYHGGNIMMPALAALLRRSVTGCQIHQSVISTVCVEVVRASLFGAGRCSPVFLAWSQVLLNGLGSRNGRGLARRSPVQLILGVLVRC